MATFVLGAVGAVIGSAVGGPAGAKLGWSIGTTIGGVIDAMNQPGVNIKIGKLSDLRVSGSDYGAHLTRVWGKVRVPGNIIWVAKDEAGNHLVEHKKTKTSGGGGSGGGGKAKQTTYWYTASYAVALGIGTIMRPDGTFIHRNPVLKKVWADDKVIWEAGMAEPTVELRFYEGTETQIVDTLIEAVEGVGQAPAYRGIMYVVFEDHDLSDFGNRIPNLSFEIWTDDVTVADIVGDIAAPVGITSSMMDLTLATHSVPGFVQIDRSPAQDLMNLLLYAMSYDLVDVDGKIKPVPRGGASVVTIPQSDLGIRSENAEHVPKIIRSLVNERELPGRIDVTYFDRDKNYEQVTQGEVRHSADVFNSISYAFPMSWTKTEARRMAAQHLDTAWIEGAKFQIALGLKYIDLAPADPFTVSDLDGNIRLRIIEMDLGDPGEIRCTVVIDDESVTTQGVEGGTGGNGGGSNLTPVPTDFMVWSGTELRNDDQNAPGFYVVGNGAAGWRGASVYYSPDLGVTWILAGELSGRGTFGETASALANGTTPRTWDNVNDVDVILDYGELGSTTENDVLNGNNIAVVGDEILGFATASLTGSMAYTLSDLYRGIRDSIMTGHVIGERFVYADAAIERISVPANYIGEVLQVKCVSPYMVLADVIAQNVTISAPTPGDTEDILLNSIYPIDIIPQLVMSGAGPTAGWQDLDLSAYVPANAKRVKFQVYHRTHEQDSTLRIEHRTHNGGAHTDMMRVGAIEGSQDISSGTVDVDRALNNDGSRTCQVQVTCVSGNPTWEIYLLAYWRTI